MALFGDEQRFYPGICESNGISNIYGKVKKNKITLKYFFYFYF